MNFYLVINYSIHSHSNTVLGQYFLWRNIKGDSSEVNNLYAIHAGDDEKQSRANCSTSLNST